MTYLIGLDLGSGSIRAGAFGLDGSTAAIASRPSASVTPDPSRPDHIVWPAETVWKSTCDAVQEVMSRLPAGAEIAGVAAACLGMDGLPLDRDGKPLYDFIAWSDGRCVPYYEAWARDFGEDRQFLTTGTPARGFSTLFRLQWMADHHPEILQATHKWLLMADFINFRLSGALATDYSMAACTLLFDPASNSWHEGIARAANVDTALMCDAMPSGTVLGAASAAAAKATGLPEGTPVILGGHDYLCGVLPVDGHKVGTVVNVGGTWDVIQATIPAFVLPPAAAGTGWTVEPHVAPGKFSAYGAAIGGAVTNWFRDECLADLAGDDAAYFRLANEAAGRRAGSVMFLPHLAGATGPVIDPHAAGAFVGLRAGHSRTDLLAAVFEGLNFQTREILDSAAPLGVDADRLVFVGGNSRNQALVQSKADTLGLPVDVPEVGETTCLGAAMLAGLGAGCFTTLDEAVEAMRSPTRRTEPDLGQTGAISERLGLFRELYQTLNSTHHKLGQYPKTGKQEAPEPERE